MIIIPGRFCEHVYFAEGKMLSLLLMQKKAQTTDSQHATPDAKNTHGNW